MKKWYSLLVLLLMGAFLPGLQCTPSNPNPPSNIGGVTSAGGSTAAGGSVDVGGSTYVTSTPIGGSPNVSTTAAVRFPECNSASKKAAPVDVTKFRLGRRLSNLRHHRKASYTVSETAVSTFWAPLLKKAMNQGSLGSCAGNAPVVARLHLPYAIETFPTPWSTWTTPEQFEKLAVEIYSAATLIDPFDGAYPPDDTGTDVASTMSVATSKGLFTGYHAISTLAELQSGLNKGTCILGVDWFNGFFTPTRCGELAMTGNVMGGHAIAAVGDDVDKKAIWIENQWDNDWGTCLEGHCGFAYFTYGVMSDLIARNGEVYCPN